MSPSALNDKLRSNEPFTVLDLRDRDEFEQWHVDGPAVEAVQVSNMEFVQAKVTGSVAELVDGLVEPIVAICARGESSAEAAEELTAVGFEAYNLEGGMSAWAELYEAYRVDVDDATVIQYHRPSSGCLAYLVESGGEAAVIDPLQAFTDRYVAAVDDLGATLRYAIDTHVHADHVSGIRDVAETTAAESVLPAGARERGLAFDTRLVEDGDALGIGDADIVAVAAPGHTTEMTAYSLGDVVFTGDSLFLESVARLDLEAGAEGAPEAARELYRTLNRRFGRLSPEVRIAPGHVSERAAPATDGTYTRRVDTLRHELVALSLGETAFLEYVLGDMPPRPSNFEKIIDVNLGRDTVTPDEAFDLELGPNNCAATTSDGSAAGPT
ncbi:MAG: MBL fold metallo-hydrolase [Halobacteriota archaeon]